MSRTLMMLDGLRREIEAREAELVRPRGGQHVPHFGDFSGVSPWALKRIAWWERALREALEDDLTRPETKDGSTN